LIASRREQNLPKQIFENALPTFAKNLHPASFRFE